MSATPHADRLAAMTDAELIEAAYEADRKGDGMNIAALVTAVAGLVGAVGALIAVIRHQNGPGHKP